MNRLLKILRNKWFLIGTGLLVAYTLAGFLLGPYLTRRYVPRIIHDQLGKQAAIGEVRINPFLFTLEVNDFRMDEPDGQPIVGCKQLFVDFELNSLFKWAWTFRQISLLEPTARLVIERDGSLNLAKLSPPAQTPPPQPQPAASTTLPRLIFQDILLDQGKIDFIDQRQSQPATVSLSPLCLHVKGLATLPERQGMDEVIATTEKGETIRWHGKISLQPVMVQGSLAFENIHAATLWQFSRDNLLLEPPAGKLTVTADYNIDLSGQAPQATIEHLVVDLSGLVLHLADNAIPFLELPDTRISDGRFDLNQRQIELGKLAVNGGRVNLAKDESGTFNLQRLNKTAETKSADTGPAQDAAGGKPWKLTLKQFDLNGLAIGYQDMQANASIGALRLAMQAAAEVGGESTKLQMNDLAVEVNDIQAGLTKAASPAVKLSTVALKGGVFDLASNQLNIAEIAVTGGNIEVERQADGNLNLARLAKPTPKQTPPAPPAQSQAPGQPFQFLINRVAIANLGATLSDFLVQPDGPLLHLENIDVELTHVDNKSTMPFAVGVNVREGGQLKTTGTFNPAGPAVEAVVQVTTLGLPVLQPYISQAAAVVLKSGSLSTNGTLRHGVKDAKASTTYQGGVKIENLRVTETDSKETLVGWKTVQTEQLQLQLAPDKLAIGELKVVQPAGKFIINKDHTLNLTEVMKAKAAPVKPEEKEQPATPAAFPYRVDRMRVSGGQVEFADFSLPTPFGTKIHELKGNVAGISSAPNARAQIKLDGRVDDFGTANVDGELASGDPKEFTDISVVFRNVEMSRLTPYSGKFAGRKIDSGKLSVDLKYKIDKGQLTGDNQLVVERLRLGDKVESPEAVNLPLDLAVALLQDRNGVIDLGLPVHGDLNSPEFSYGGLIWKALTNVLTKLVTSPFRALSALLPGGDEESMDSVAFATGKAEVAPPEKEKLAQLAGVLEKRPRLKLVVQGCYSPTSDLHELRVNSVRLALNKRLNIPVEPGEDPGPVDFSNSATRDALADMFKERFDKKALSALKDETKAAAKKSGGDDPGTLAKALYARLVESEPISDAELVRLADARAQAVVAALNEAKPIPAERLAIKTSAAMEQDGDGPATVALSLEAVQ